MAGLEVRTAAGVVTGDDGRIAADAAAVDAATASLVLQGLVTGCVRVLGGSCVGCLTHLAVLVLISVLVLVLIVASHGATSGLLLLGHIAERSNS